MNIFGHRTQMTLGEFIEGARGTLRSEASEPCLLAFLRCTVFTIACCCEATAEKTTTSGLHRSFGFAVLKQQEVLSHFGLV